jgi:hypothetical protein
MHNSGEPKIQAEPYRGALVTGQSTTSSIMIRLSVWRIESPGGTGHPLETVCHRRHA